MEIRSQSFRRDFGRLGRTENSPNAAIGDSKRRIYGLQFHPEVAHTPRGKGDPGEFCPSHLRLQVSVDDGLVYRAHLRADPRGRRR